MENHCLPIGDDTDLAYREADVSAPWRRYGQTRRRELLEDDRRKGGTKFNLNTSCSIHRYFQVAQRVSDQLGDLYATLCTW
jgi:hypothetical protein